MTWYFSFVAAMIVFALGLGLLLSKKGKVLYVLMGTCYFGAFALGFAPYYVMSGGYIADAFVSAFTQALLVFTGEANYSIMDFAVHTAPEWMGAIYTFMLLGLQVAAPLLTAGFVLSLFQNISGRISLLIFKFRDVYVFSQLNEKAVTLAEDLRRNHPKAKVVFADVTEGENALIHRAKALGGMCMKQSITGIPLNGHGKNANVTFFAISDDESQNIRQSMKLLERYNHRPNTHLYLFSTGDEGEVLLSGMERGAMKVRRIHEDRALVFRLLYQQGESLFQSAVPMDDGQKQITAVIVGLDGRGVEMLKALSWFGQMGGYRLTIHAFDADPQAKAHFEAQCPELMSMSGNQIPGEAQYEILIHGDCPVDSLNFAQEVAAINNATWVFVTAGSDEENIRTAAMLRTQFRRSGCMPQIRAVVRDGGICPVLGKATNHSGEGYEILPVGDVASCYSEAVILQSDAEADAFRRHKAYCNGDPEREEDFWRFEYCYRSSMASAIHAVARKQCLDWAQVPEKELTDAQRQALEQLEHCRWNAYMRSEGYVYGETRDNLGKIHHNLVPFETLSQADRRKDSRVAAENG